VSVPDPAAISYDDGSRHVEAVVRSSTLMLRGPMTVRALIISPVTDRGALLLHRLAELHARLGVGQYPFGADLHDRLHLASTGWTSGFWPGALWQAASLVPGAGGRMFASWALSATVHHFGLERSDTHDVGFMYGESSLAAWQALCSGRRRHPSVCRRLRASVLAAADELRVLAASNRRAGTIPTNAVSPRADTIIDSMMNIAILPWASAVTGNRAYAELALRHANRIASLLVRPDGSTAQAVDFVRRSGRVVRIGTHQGLSASSTWSRGQGWGVYGFSLAASELRSRALLRVALRLAAYVAGHLPAGGIPLWDYDAHPGAPVDVSAGVITAAGLFHLASACRELSGVCGDPSVWVALGQRMLSAAIARASVAPPLGLLGGQVLDERRHGCWCNGGELIFGLTYALEGLRRSELAG
jgi:unsaturated chondroitin disaccharide hydrolase